MMNKSKQSNQVGLLKKIYRHKFFFFIFDLVLKLSGFGVSNHRSVVQTIGLWRDHQSFMS